MVAILNQADSKNESTISGYFIQTGRFKRYFANRETKKTVTPSFDLSGHDAAFSRCFVETFPWISIGFIHFMFNLNRFWSRHAALRLSWSPPKTPPPQSVPRLCSGHAQYSAQSLQLAAGARYTTLLSHLADVPELLYSVPHSSLPPSSLPPSFGPSSTVTHIFSRWACGECFSDAQAERCLLCIAAGGMREGDGNDAGDGGNKDEFRVKPSSRNNRADCQKSGSTPVFFVLCPSERPECFWSGNRKWSLQALTALWVQLHVTESPET